MGQSVKQEDWFAVFKFRVTVKAHLIRYDCLYHSSWTVDLFTTKFKWMVHPHKVDCLVKRLDCSVVVKVKVTEKVQNFSECLSGQYLLFLWTLYNQTWYGDATSCVMQEDWFAVFKFRVTVRAGLIKYDCFYHICWTADLFATKFNWKVHHHKLECFV